MGIIFLIHCSNPSPLFRGRVAVTPYEHLRLSPYLSYLSGAIAGCAATLGSYPFDLLRTILASQGEPKIYPNMRSAFVDILRTRGIRGLYFGLSPTLVEIIPYAGLQFGTYDTFKRWMMNWHRFMLSNTGSPNNGDSLSSFEIFLCGFAAGTSAKAVCHPLDVVKKRFQIEGLQRDLKYGARVERSTYRNMYDALLQILRNEGWAGLYKGIYPSLIKSAPAGAVTFVAYEYISDFLENYSKRQPQSTRSQILLQVVYFPANSPATLSVRDFQLTTNTTGTAAGFVIARNIHNKDLNLLKNTRHMTPSLMEKGARLVVTKFLQRFISTGCLILLEDGGDASSFGETKPSCLKSIIKVHSPLFYWKIATEADIGLAEAYINGYFSFVDQKGGLLDFILLLIANNESRYTSTNKQNKRGWWTPLLCTAGIASAKYYLQHISTKNSISQAIHNISQHYDQSNEFFSLFLDERMQYSCPIFKNANEGLEDAQLRKISVLIDKANIDAKHEILEIGCGWGGFAIEVVKQTGCKYTGVTLSIEQLKFAKRRVEEAGLQEKITLLLCDYRQLSKSRKYDRIISCEMIEAVGHEYMEEYFSCCENLLAEDGIIVLQFTSVPDQRYEEQRQTPGFILDIIFPGGCLPSLNRVVSAMTSSSQLCVEHVENIGIHFYRGLMYWRENLMTYKCKILALGFDERFIRKWEYYFMFCAACFKSRIIGNYQVVFSRPGNLKAFKDSYKGSDAEQYPHKSCK
ncbi:uncharacterized protein LOC110019824 [Phalaenopsis equestris]|uniref:uncharacterized protein LOC110019824 n=1 Tax=Phalaenopsis equestris TaxID=78828 RepID=UPI0009E3B396|nr:uncharacterized protein LOC110019824 [Phalaenopsis equestris]